MKKAVIVLALWIGFNSVSAMAQTTTPSDIAQTRNSVAAINNRLASLRLITFTGQRPNVSYPAEVRAWMDNGAVVKLEVIERDDSGDVVSEFYYDNNALVFVYEAVKGFVEGSRPSKQVTRSEERYYFRDGKLIRWMSGMGNNQSEAALNSAAFADAARSQRAASAAFVRNANDAVASNVVKGRGDVSKQTSFCTANETVLFSCPLGNKMVSVCASNGATRTSGYLQYRFGKLGTGEPLEMTLPDNEARANQAATGENVPFAGGGGSWLRFRKAAFSYVIYEGIGRWGPKGEVREKAGVAVEQSGKLVANIKCTARPTGTLTPDWYEKMDVKPKQDEDFLFP